MSEQSLAIRGHGPLEAAPLLPSTGEWQTMVQMAGMLVKTGFLPETIKTGEQAVAIILKGRELRLPPMYALSNIVVVSGKPTASAELMLALLYRDHGDGALVVEESTPELCRVTYRRRGWDRPRGYAFTIADATTAQLTGSATWKKYPAAMLRARCISAVARMAFPDSIAGMYLPEELGAEVRVADDGAVELAAVSVPVPAPAPPSVPSAAVDRMQALIDDLDAPAPTDDVAPVTEETRLAWGALIDEIEAANPKVKVKLPPDAAGDRVWRAELAAKRAAWQTSPHNPAAAAATATA